ncbi:hypothetical protein CFP56_016687 [Quercus suber]|uniref:Uncharacterized protein n=1 Tax=Quercus suber TaxID=58331 RepID=A0AAW0KMK7_QUESU
MGGDIISDDELRAWWSEISSPPLLRSITDTILGRRKGPPTRNLKLAKEFKRGERYEIGWLNGRPVGPHARDLINECTKLVRAQQNVPLKFTYWKKVPYINKRKLFDKVLFIKTIANLNLWYKKCRPPISQQKLSREPL